MPLYARGQNAAAQAVIDGANAGVTGAVIAVSLHTGSPGTNPANLANEVSGGGYSRATTSATEWGDASAGSLADGVIANTAVIDFANASGDWGNVTHFVVHDSTGPRFFGQLATARNIVDGTTDIEFAAGTLTVTIPTG